MTPRRNNRVIIKDNLNIRYVFLSCLTVPMKMAYRDRLSHCKSEPRQDHYRQQDITNCKGFKVKEHKIVMIIKY